MIRRSAPERTARPSSQDGAIFQRGITRSDTRRRRLIYRRRSRREASPQSVKHDSARSVLSIESIVRRFLSSIVVDLCNGRMEELAYLCTHGGCAQTWECRRTWPNARIPGWNYRSIVRVITRHNGGFTIRSNWHITPAHPLLRAIFIASLSSPLTLVGL
jgi:hypothetical protein